MKKFKFELEDRLKIKESDEAGLVIARAQYLSGEDMYHIRYKAGDGRAVQVWWSEGALIKT